MFQQVAPALIAYPHWLNWRYEKRDGKSTKVPYDPRTGTLARVNDPNTWCDFRVAVENAHKYSGIGFVLSEIPGYENPFTFIDFDHTSIQENLDGQIRFQSMLANTYNELSPSGNGIHIVGVGSVEKGMRAKDCEVYSTHRFMTVTGELFQEPKDCIYIQPALDQLVTWMRPKVRTAIANQCDAPIIHNDQQVWQMVLNSSVEDNREKANALVYGGWESYYAHGDGRGDQSRADQALVNMIAHYTDNMDQVTRMFLASQLGQRDKAQKRPAYVRQMVVKSFDQKQPTMDETQRNAWRANIMQSGQKVKQQYHNGNGKPKQTKLRGILDRMPDGLIRSMTEYIYTTSPKPMLEASFFGALGMFAGVCGRAYNVNKTGLNLYLCLVARAGGGKEGMKDGVSELIRAANQNVSFRGAADFEGPSLIASGQALYSLLQESQLKSCYAMVSEFGARLYQMRTGKNVAERNLSIALHDLYSKSGFRQSVGANIFSDTTKNREPIHAPALTIVGESTPGLFRKGLSSENIQGGLVSRLIIANCTAPIQVTKLLDYAPPNPQIVEQLLAVMQQATNLLRDFKQPIDIPIPQEFWLKFTQLESVCNKRIENSELFGECWSRVMLNSLRMSALFAIGRNHIAPALMASDLEWSFDFCEQSVYQIIEFAQQGLGDETQTEATQLSIVEAVIKKYLDMDADKLGGVTNQRLRERHIVRESWLYRQVEKRTAFKFGKQRAMKECLDVLSDEGVIALLDTAAVNQLNVNGVIKRVRTDTRLWAIVEPDNLG